MLHRHNTTETLGGKVMLSSHESPRHGSLAWSGQVPSSKTKVEGELEETEGATWLAKGAIQRLSPWPSPADLPEIAYRDKL